MLQQKLLATSPEARKTSQGYYPTKTMTETRFYEYCAHQACLGGSIQNMCSAPLYLYRIYYYSCTVQPYTVSYSIVRPRYLECSRCDDDDMRAFMI